MSWKRGTDATWARTVIGEGSPGEVKLGRVGGRRLLATVEPWHGAGVAVYAEKPGLWAKTTIETISDISGLPSQHQARSQTQRRPGRFSELYNLLNDPHEDHNV